MPFKQYKILSYRSLPYHGFYDYGNTIHPYEFTVIVKSWWGLKEKTVKKKVGVVLGTNVERIFRIHKDKWISKWIGK